MRPPCGTSFNVRRYYSSGNIGGRAPPMVITSNEKICLLRERRYRLLGRVSNLFVICSVDLIRKELRGVLELA